MNNVYTAVSKKVVEKKLKAYATMSKGSLENTQYILIKAQNPFCFFNTRKEVFIAPPSIALKTRELDDATVNNHNPSCLLVLSRTLLKCFSVGQPFSKQLYLKCVFCVSVCFLFCRNKSVCLYKCLIGLSCRHKRVC